MYKKRVLSAILLCTVALLLFLLTFISASQSRKDSLGYEPDLSSEYLVTQYPDASGQQANCYTISNEDTLIVIDGGWADNADALRKIIATHGNQVDAWIITHPHKDHAGAFNVIYADPQGITISNIYDNGFDYDFIESVGEPYDDITVMETYYTLTKDAANVTHLKRGDELTICGLSFSIYNAFDDVVKANVGNEKDYQNNASLLFQVRSAHNSILFSADIKYDMSDYLLAQYGDVIASDYVQLSHHGNWGLSKDFYDKTNGTVFFLDAPSEISDNPDFPASQLKKDLIQEKRTVLDFSTAPNTVTLK